MFLWKKQTHVSEADSPAEDETEVPGPTDGGGTRPYSTIYVAIWFWVAADQIDQGNRKG